MREVKIEDYFKRKVMAADCLCLKFVSPGHTGVPDRVVIRRDGKTFYVELKAPGETLRPDQVYWRDVLRGYNCPHYVVDSKARADEVVKEIMG